MASDISVGIGVLGEKEFQKALDECQNSLKQIDSGLKATTAEFGKNDDAIKDNAESLKLLQKGYDENKKIVDALGEAIEWSKKEYGEFSKETTKYVVAQNKAREGAARFKKELEDSNREMTDLGRDAGRVGRQLEQGLGEAADDVSRKMDSLINTLDADLSDIGSAADFSAFKDGFDLTMDVIGGIDDAFASLTEGTEEYRRTMSFLNQNALTAGMGPQVIKDMTFEVAALTGELDGAVEGMSNLMAAGFEEDELATAVDRLSAAVIQFPDTLKFESLADSLQESVATGQAVGQYAEYLERMGLDLDTVNQSFEEAAKKGPEAVETVALAWLTNPDAEKALETYKSMNEDLLESEEAQQRFNDALAGLGTSLTPAATAWTDFKTGVITGITEMIEEYKKWNEALLQRNEEAKQVVDIAIEDSQMLDSLEAYNEAIAQADTEGAYVRANALMAERDKFLKEQAQKTAQELDTVTQEDAETIGKNIVTELGNGILEAGSGAISQAKQLWEAIAAELSKPISGPKVGTPSEGAGSASGTGSTAQTASVSLELDGRTLGRTTVEYNSASIGAAIDRYEIYG